MELQSVVLEKRHEELGAKMVPFAGYNMPVRYTSDIEEHKVVREKVGLFDVSHMGEFLVKGKEALDFLQYVTSNDVSKLAIGDIQYAYLPNNNGGVVDDLLVYRTGNEDYLLVVNASNIEKDFDWIKSLNTFDATLENVSDQYSLFALQGPKAVEVMNKISSKDLTDTKYYTFLNTDLGSFKDVFVSATGYTGAGGFEVMVENDQAIAVWDLIMYAGEEFGIQPVGLGARDTLRLEKGYCLYGNDIDDSTSPIAAGLGWVTKFTKDFVSKAAIQKDKEEGVLKKLVAFKLIDKGIPRAGYVLESASGVEIGSVTSGSMSPMLSVGIGLGYVTTENSKVGSEVIVAIRNKKIKAEIVKLPFV